MGVDDPFHLNGNDQKTKSLYLFFLRRTVHNFFFVLSIFNAHICRAYKVVFRDPDVSKIRHRPGKKMQTYTVSKQPRRCQRRPNVLYCSAPHVLPVSKFPLHSF